LAPGTQASLANFEQPSHLRVAGENPVCHGLLRSRTAEEFTRDVKLCTIGEGTSEIQRLVIARQLLKE